MAIITPNPQFSYADAAKRTWVFRLDFFTVLNLDFGFLGVASARLPVKQARVWRIRVGARRLSRTVIFAFGKILDIFYLVLSLNLGAFQWESVPVVQDLGIMEKSQNFICLKHSNSLFGEFQTKEIDGWGIRTLNYRQNSSLLSISTGNRKITVFSVFACSTLEIICNFVFWVNFLIKVFFSVLNFVKSWTHG